MNDFNHDAAMHRGAKLQSIIEKTLAECHDQVSAADPEESAYEELCLLASAIWLSHIGGPVPATPSGLRASRFAPKISAIVRKFKDTPLEKAELQYAILKVARSLLESGASRVVSEHAKWESQHFRS